MESSDINMIDLKLLSNPSALYNLNKLEEEPIDIIDKKELEFYKIRIFNTAKEILQNKDVEPKLKELFYHFANKCISYYKFTDKSDNIQKDYIHLEKKQKKPSEFKNISDSNKMIMKEKKVRIPKITDHIKIKTRQIKKTFIPKKRNLNLKDPKYKVKGINKKKTTGKSTKPNKAKNNTEPSKAKNSMVPSKTKITESSKAKSTEPSKTKITEPSKAKNSIKPSKEQTKAKNKKINKKGKKKAKKKILDLYIHEQNK